MTNLGLKSNKNVSISPEFDLWTWAAGQILKKFHFREKG